MRREPDRYGWPSYRTQMPVLEFFSALAWLFLSSLGELFRRRPR